MVTNETSYDSVVLTKSHTKFADWWWQIKRREKLNWPKLDVSSKPIKIGLVIEHLQK